VVLKLSTGADFAAAFNREPDLGRSKVRAVYLLPAMAPEARNRNTT
jgi:hypothetical protein